MAKNNKGKLFYEITKEKPSGKSQVLLAGGSVGAVFSFFIVSLVGSLCGVELDDLILFFILSCGIGFLIGVILTWLFVRNFSKVVSVSSVLTPEAAEIKPEVESQPGVSAESVVSAEEADKGQSVDFVFPELSPDK